MKYKVLVSGKNNPIIDDFFIQMDNSFEVISTSTRFGDIIRHLKYFNPDVFIYCLYNESQDSLRQMVNIKQTLAPSRIPFVLIGSKGDCDEFEKVAVNVANMVLVKPFTAASIQEKIVNFLDERQEYVKAYREKAEEEEERESKQSSIPDISALKATLSSLEEALSAPDVPVPPKQAAAKQTDKKPAAQTEEAAPKPEPNPDERKHILVVDDDPIMLKMLKEHLHDVYDVATAISGKIAMKFLERKTTDLILLDYEMPVENGPAVLEKIREKDTLKEIPVIFLTGVSEREKIQEALALRPQSYLLKPIDRDKLLDTITSVIG